MYDIMSLKEECVCSSSIFNVIAALASTDRINDVNHPLNSRAWKFLLSSSDPVINHNPLSHGYCAASNRLILSIILKNCEI